MSATPRRRLARKLHECDTCRTVIPSGHVYLLHTLFPGNDVWPDITAPWHLHECADCAIRYGRDNLLDPVPPDQPYRYWLGDVRPRDLDPLDGAAS